MTIDNTRTEDGCKKTFLKPARFKRYLPGDSKNQQPAGYIVTGHLWWEHRLPVLESQCDMELLNSLKRGMFGEKLRYRCDELDQVTEVYTNKGALLAKLD